MTSEHVEIGVPVKQREALTDGVGGDQAIGGGDVPQGPVTYDTGPEAGSQQVLPASQRRPLHATLIPANADQTVVVPLHYLCNPRGHGIHAVATQAWVTWQLWGEHHSQWMSLPQPLITKSGELCPGGGPIQGPVGS